MNCWVRWRTLTTGCVLLSLMSLLGCTPAASESGDSAPVIDLPETSQPSLESNLDQSLLPQGQILPVTAEVELGGQLIGLEVAETPQQQAIGLMARESLSDDRGMLFPFEPPRAVSFWMKNVLIPLDMVFIRDGKIVAIAREVPPCESNPCPTYGPADEAVDYVLELRGGLAASLGLQSGDSVDIEWLEPNGEGV